MNGVLQFFFVFFGSVYFAKNSGNQCKLKEVVQLFSVFLCVVATMGIQMGNMRFTIFIPSHHLAILCNFISNHIVHESIPDIPKYIFF